MTLSFEDILQARKRLGANVHRTPVVTSATLDRLAGCRAFLKCENLQRGGSFKVRGAMNRMMQLAEDEKQRGVVAFSSGNHAQGVAIAARDLGIAATIVMPDDAPKSKIAATEGYGATVVRYDRLREDREAIARRLSEEQGRTVIPPFDDYRVMAGQGTMVLEMLDEVDTLDVLAVAIGGGGLLSGCAVAARAKQPGIRVVGIEPATANDAWLSFQAGERVTTPPSDTIADGLRATAPGKLTFPILRENVDDIVLVTDDEIREAMRFLLFRMKLLVEPSGAVGVAALLAGKLPDRAGKRVGIVLCGGNVDADALKDIL